MAATAAYVGSQGRNLFLRSVANQIVDVVTNPNPASAAFVIREFSHRRSATPRARHGVQNPYAEVDYKTSGGHDSYNALMLSLNKRSANGLTMNAQYTLGKSQGNTGGSNEATTAANNARALDEFDYDDGYNNFDVRHTFNLSVLYSLPYGHGRNYGSDIGVLTRRAARRLGRRRHRQRAQRPAGAGPDRRPDIVYRGRARQRSSPTRRRAARRSSTCPAAAPRATCGGPT